MVKRALTGTDTDPTISIEAPSAAAKPSSQSPSVLAEDGDTDETVSKELKTMAERQAFHLNSETRSKETPTRDEDRLNKFYNRTEDAHRDILEAMMQVPALNCFIMEQHSHRTTKAIVAAMTKADQADADTYSVHAITAITNFAYNASENLHNNIERLKELADNATYFGTRMTDVILNNILLQAMRACNPTFDERCVLSYKTLAYYGADQDTKQWFLKLARCMTPITVAAIEESPAPENKKRPNWTKKQVCHACRVRGHISSIQTCLYTITMGSTHAIVPTRAAGVATKHHRFDTNFGI
jgi:hypothetical protein